jgi:hypothetical protein
VTEPPLDEDGMNFYLDTLKEVQSLGGFKEEDGLVRMPLKNGIQGVQAMLSEYLGGTTAEPWRKFVGKIESSCAFRLQAKASNTSTWVDQVGWCRSAVTAVLVRLPRLIHPLAHSLRASLRVQTQETLMTSVVTEYLTLRDRARTVLRALFRAGDVDGDGNLTVEEFSKIVRLADSERPMRCVTHCHKRALVSAFHWRF